MDDKINYKIKRSNRRTIAIVLKPDGNVIVRAPYEASVEFIDNLVREKHGWIRKKLALIESEDTGAPLKNFVEGEEFPYFGRMYGLRFGENVKDVIEIKDDLLIDSEYKNYVQAVLKVFYRYRAYEYLKERVIQLSRETGLGYKDIKITNGKYRLATCTQDNRLRFSYLLVMIPVEISDYIIYHELSHIKEKNHSPRFWKLVEVYVPDYRQKKKWLKENINKYKFL
jgi:hypothetical protein